MIRSWRSLGRLLEGSRRLVAASVAISISRSLLLVPIAFLVRHAFNVTIPAGDSVGLAWTGALILALFLANSALGLLTRWLALRATKEAITRLRVSLLGKVFALPRSYFDRSDLGTLHSTIVQDTERLDIMANALIAVLMPTVVIGAALSATMIVLDPLLAALLLITLPALYLLSRRLGPRVRAHTKIWQRASDIFSTQTQLALRSVTLTKLHGAEQSELERRRIQLAELGEAGRTMAWWQSCYTLLNGAISAAGGVIVLVVGGAAVAEGRISVGELISFYAVLGLMRTQLMGGLVTMPQMISGTESLARLERILEEEATETYRGSRALAFHGAVALERVSFEYRPGEPVLNDISLQIAPGEKVVLLGPNGAGKSTILSLIAGLYAPTSGRVLADGVALTEVDLAHLRRAMGVIVQDPLIFPASVRENIAFGRPDASPDELERAARRAGAHEFIEELPGGYDAAVGDEGVLLSGGQRQRIAIARALLGDPALLMLDEPTVHLDSKGIADLMWPLIEDPDGPTILIVSHDHAVAASVDSVYHLRDGRLGDGEDELVMSTPLEEPAPHEANRG
jgi:ATP-binding cassette, subfamily B, bacterial